MPYTAGPHELCPTPTAPQARSRSTNARVSPGANTPPWTGANQPPVISWIWDSAAPKPARSASTSAGRSCSSTRCATRSTSAALGGGRGGADGRTGRLGGGGGQGRGGVGPGAEPHVGREGAMDREGHRHVAPVVRREAPREFEDPCRVRTRRPERGGRTGLDEQRRHGDGRPDPAEAPAQVTAQVEHAEMQACRRLDEQRRYAAHLRAGEGWDRGERRTYSVR